MTAHGSGKVMEEVLCFVQRLLVGAVALRRSAVVRGAFPTVFGSTPDRSANSS